MPLVQAAVRPQRASTQCQARQSQPQRALCDRRMALAGLALLPQLLPQAGEAAEALSQEYFTGEGFQETDTGLIYRVDREGEGKRVSSYIPNAFVTVNFEGYLLNGKVFDSTAIRRKAFSFQAGLGQRVAPGFDEAVYDMRVGEVRRVFVPPELGFGRRGMPAGVPPNAPLVYDIELLSLQPY